MTSRDQGVLAGMKVHPNVITTQVLSEEESWSLFEEKAGDCVNHEDLKFIAKDVANECKGLPVALATVGSALKDKEISIWENALLQLRNSNLAEIPDVLRDAYNPLKLSYDCLNQQERSLFLLCSMFAEDSDIPLEYLTWYGMGLRIFEGTLNFKEARDRVCTLVYMLKSRSLLLDGCNKHHVKMHDVVRDMAIFIASKDYGGTVIYPNNMSMGLPRKESCSNFNWISMISKEPSTELPNGLPFPNLQLLMMENMKSSYMVSLDNFFEGMEKLNVVSFENIRISSLPQSTKLLKNLRTLRLYECVALETIAAVGELASLEILSCRNCYWIKELPADIGSLSQLRFLELYNCSRLSRIAPGVISKLVQLEELKIRGSFCGWEGMEDREERRNASLTELECLQKLTWLEIEINCPNLATTDIRLSSKIVRYDITIFQKEINRYVSLNSQIDYKNNVNLDLPSEITLGNWICTFLRSTEFLDLKGHGSNRLNLVELKNVKFLQIRDCSTMNKLLNDMDCRSDIFPVLKDLDLFLLPKLEHLWKTKSFLLPKLEHLWKSPKQNVSFRNLRSIKIASCKKLRNLFSLSMERGLSQLEILQIKVCEAMEEVFINDGKDGKGHLAFPKLKELTLQFLPSLTMFCKGVEGIEFPQLTDLRNLCSYQD